MPVKTKIVSILARSVLSTTYTDQVVAIIEDGLYLRKSDADSNATSTTSSRDRTVMKLRTAVFTFVNFLARNAAQKDLRLVAPTLIPRLRNFIEDQGWPKLIEGELELRAFAYDVIALLAKAAPDETLLEPELKILRWLFRSLEEDTSSRDVSASIADALSSLVIAFSGSLHNDILPYFRETLLQSMRLDEDSLIQQKGHFELSGRLPFVALRFANQCLPYEDVTARWMNIIAVGYAGISQHELIEEGKKGLDPHWHTMQRSIGQELKEASASVKMPEYEELMQVLFPTPQRWGTDLEGQMTSRLERFRNRFSLAFNPAIQYAYRVFVAHALRSGQSGVPVDTEWQRKIDTILQNDPQARDTARKYIKIMPEKTENHRNSYLLLSRATFEAMTEGTGQAQSDLGERLVELCALTPSPILQQSGIVERFDLLQDLVVSNNTLTRNVAARAFGLLASLPSAPGNKVSNMLHQLKLKAESWHSAIGSEINASAGAIVALAYYASRWCYRDSRPLSELDWSEEYVQILLTIAKDSRDHSLKDAVYIAIGQLSLYCTLSPSSIASTLPVNELADILYDGGKAGNERAISALGYLSIIQPDDEPSSGNGKSSLQHIRDKLYELHEVRQVEVQFAVGGALSCFACGWESSLLFAEQDIEGPTPSGPARSNLFPKVLEKTLSDCKTTKPSLRKAAVVWLLCLVQSCGHIEEAQAKLPACQAAFLRCLSVNDETVQEAASRGLGLVYEKGSRELKKDLVQNLVGTFTTNKPGLAGNVSADTQLFEEGALPTGDGSVTTYKDILSLASEVGDSSLVYRFMSLAANSSIWSSRAAFGRFGLSNVLSDSSVDGYLADNPKLYPKLFRYRFDPNPNVQRSMNDIWTALVKNPSATIDKYFDAIMEDLLQSILTKEWRVRQASCAAIGDLIQGRSIEKYDQYLGQIWSLCFKVLDDIKESVRAAAAGLARVLSGILTRSLEGGGSSSKKAIGMLKDVIPFLFSTSGLESSAQEVQAFALVTLIDIIKKGSGRTLRPYIPEIIERIIGLLSTLESEVVNYLHLNASKYGTTEQEIDDKRLQMIRGSPLMDSIERCIDLLDEASMAELVPRLEAAMKTSVGLPSKVGCSRVLVSLSTRRMLLFQPYSGRFLALIEKHIHDRNETVMSSYAVASGYIARTATEKQLLRLSQFCKNLYFSADEDRNRLASADIIHAISKHASDKFKSISSEILPLVFVAQHDSHQEVKRLYKETWEDNVGGSRAVALYLKEIVELAQTHLESSRHVVKHTSATAIAEAIIAVAGSVDALTLEQAKILWPALNKAIDGKTWEGKENVLRAFVRFVEKGKNLWASDTTVAKQITKIIVREAKRQNKAYQQYAIRALGQVAAARTDVDMFDDAHGICVEVVEGNVEKDEDAMDIDQGKGAGSSEMYVTLPPLAPMSQLTIVRRRNKTLAGAVESMNDAVLVDTKGDKTSERLLKFLDLATKANTAFSATLQTATFDSLKEILTKLGAAPTKANVGDRLATLLFDARSEGLSEAIRLKKAQAMTAAAPFREQEEVKNTMVAHLTKEISTERSDVVKAELQKAMQAFGG